MPTDGPDRRWAGVAVVVVLAVAVAVWWRGETASESPGEVVTKAPEVAPSETVPGPAPAATAPLVDPAPEPVAEEPPADEDAAGTAPAPAPMEGPGPATVRLRVVDAVANTVAGALVRTWSDEAACEEGLQPLWTGYTDAGGRCTVFMPDKSTVLVAEAEGLGTSGMWDLYRLQFPDRVVDGESIVTLLATVHVSGTVFHADGRPAALAGVSFWSWGWSPASGSARSPPAAETDAAGRFSVEVDAFLFLGMRATWQERQSPQIKLEYLEPGSRHEVELRLPGNWGVSGVLLDAGGALVAGGEVTLWRHWPGRDIERPPWPMEEGAFRKHDETDGEGRFAFELDRLGDFVLVGLHEEAAPSDPVVVSIDEQRPRAEVTVQLYEAVAIAGHVLHPDGRPAAGITVSGGVGGMHYPTARLYGPTRALLFGYARDETDEQGAFELGPLHPRGRYSVTARPDPEQPRVRLTVQDVPGGADDVELVLDEAALRGAWVAGVVVAAETGDPLPAFSVEVSRRTEGGTTGRWDHFEDGAGRFRIEGLVPGAEYLLRGQAPDRADTAVPAFIASEEGRELRIELHRGGRLEVEVRDAQGRPAPLARIYLGWLDLVAKPWGRNQLAGDDGRALFEGLPQGDFQVGASLGDLRGEGEVSLPADGSDFVSIVLTPAEEGTDDP